MTDTNSLFTEASEHIVGGVNSPVRAFRAVGGEPVFFDRGEGAYIFDTQGKAYVDYVGSWGPAIVGHGHPDIVEAVASTAAKGLGFGAPNVLETRMADTICALMPSIEKLRMVNSGTEATMSAIRLARGFTGREKIVKFEGCYHGHVDALLVKAGSGALTLGVPSSPGVPASVVAQTITLDFNRVEDAEATFSEQGEDIAAVIVEPVAGNMNCVAPSSEFLHGLRELCTRHGSVLIFDEVMTGFRVALGGAQALYGIRPDLTTLGKIICGGLPVGAFGGRADIMDHLAPLGPVYQAGTLSGNPVAMAAGLATLALVAKPGFHDSLSRTAKLITQGLEARAAEHGIAFRTAQLGGMFGLFFTEAPSVTSFADVMGCDTERFSRFFHLMLDEGVYLAPSAFEAGFVSSAHGAREVEHTLSAADKAFRSLANRTTVPMS